MKLIYSLFVFLTAGFHAMGQSTTPLRNNLVSTQWIDLNGTCLAGMREQIGKEIYASGVYMAMGAFFSRDYVNRPGFADNFFKAAREEREHGSKLIEYLSMRGELTTVTDLIELQPITKLEWSSGLNALEEALDLEVEVTKSIRSLIETCEASESHDESNQKSDTKVSYYHLVDFLTVVYLDEQLRGQRELAGKISTLKKMMNSHGPLAEFLFDKNDILTDRTFDASHTSSAV